MISISLHVKDLVGYKGQEPTVSGDNACLVLSEPSIAIYFHGTLPQLTEFANRILDTVGRNKVPSTSTPETKSLVDAERAYYDSLNHEDGDLLYLLPTD